MFRSVLLVVASLLVLEPALAQVATGTPAFGSFAGSPDTINLGNLNADWTIPIVNKVGRGANFIYNLQYNSSVYYPVASGSSSTWQPVLNWGWQGLNPAGMVYADFKMGSTSGHCGHDDIYPLDTYSFSHLTYSDQHGVVHTFPAAGGSYTFSVDEPGCPGSEASPSGLNHAVSSDGTITAWYELDPGYMTAYFTDQHGNILHPPVYANYSTSSGSFSSTDPNGNEVSVSNGTYTDTLGQSALAVIGTAPSNTTLSFENNSGNYSTYTVAYTTVNILTNFGCYDITEYSASNVSLVGSITLPDGRAYSFSYEQTPGHSGYYTGRLASVTLPTGGVISYNYSGGSNGIVCADGSTAGLTRTTPDGTWTYTRSGSGTQWQTTVTAPTYNTSQDQTVINFLTDGGSPANFYEIERAQYAGSASTGTLLETVLHCYNSSTCSATAGDTSTSVTSLSQIRTTNQFPNYSGIAAGFLDSYDGYQNNTSHAIYDYSSTNSGNYGSLLQTTATTYSSAYNSIYNGEVPTEVKVTDGGSTTLSDTLYSYTATTTTTSGTPQHASGAPTQDNVASVQRWVSGSTYQTTSYTYFDTGNVQTMTDPNGTGVTTYTYNSTGCANSLLTGTSTPVKNPAGTTTATLTTGAAWNCLGGVQTSTTDMNSNVTAYSYGSDPYWRPTSVTNNSTTATASLAYPTSSSNTSSSSMSFNGGSSTTTTVTTYDSQGRPIITQTQQAPGSSNYDTVAVAYDSRGRSASQTLPYTASLGTYTTVPTQPGTSTTYDALNRKLQIEDGGGGTMTYIYSANSGGSGTPATYNALITLGPAPSGENTKRKLLAYNGAGQLASVCEITTMSGNGSCGTGSAQSGYLTLYTYDGPNLTKTQQNAQSGSGIQTRKLNSYDGLGRYASETIPEWSAGTGTAGTSSYVYDAVSSSGCTSSSAGDLVESTDNIGNVTCNTYDSMHRLLSSKVVSGLYSGTATPYSYYVYDAATYSGTSMQNVAGQLAEAYTCTGSCTSKLTDEFFSASPVTTGPMAGGALSQMWQSTPNSGGYFLTQDTYFPNGSVGAISASFGSGASSIGIPSLSFAVDGEGRPYSATDNTNSLNLVTATAYNSASLPTSITYGNAGNPSGSTSDVDSFNYDSNTYRPTYLTYGINPSSSPYSVVTQLTWNANWSLQQMAYTDGSPSPLSQTCSYTADDLSRIASNSCVNSGVAQWAQTFAYDAFGNINKTGSNGGTSYAAAYSTVTNQVSTGVTATYDANGNQLTTTTPTYLTWNALNVPIQVNSTTATYDALGRMVEKGLSGVHTQFVYRPSGDMLAVYSGSLSKGTIPLPGGSTAVYNSSGLNFIRHKDWLGSSRLATTWAHAVYSKEAYAPFGETYNEAGTADRSFTGQDQNVVTSNLGNGVYDFLFRKYDPSAGRWLSPDPAGWSVVEQTDPQSLDRYAYVENQPLEAVDPVGLNGCLSSDGQKFLDTGTGNGCPDGYQDIGEAVIQMNSCPTCFVAPPPALSDFTDSFDSLPYMGPAVNPGAPNNAYTNDVAKKLQQNCLNNFNNSGGGAVVNFFSLASPFIGPDRLDSAVEDIGGTGLKFAAYSFFKTASTSMVRTPFGSMSSLVAGTIETVAKDVVAPVAGVSTAVQVGVHLGCYLAFN